MGRKVNDENCISTNGGAGITMQVNQKCVPALGLRALIQ